MGKIRLDQLLVKRFGLSRSKAQDYIAQGKAKWKGEVVTKSSLMVDDQDVTMDLVPGEDDWVGRGAKKLLPSLEHFQLEVSNLVVLDVGASTGGFTQVFLRKGVLRVYAVDVGVGQLHPSLVQDPRVIVHEGVNVKEDFTLEESVDFLVADLSFISLKKVLRNLMRHVKKNGLLLLLFKPQFESEGQYLNKRGVLVREDIQKLLLKSFLDYAEEEGAKIEGTFPVPVKGREGNQEYFVLLKH